MSSISQPLPPGQYSAGSVQVRYTDDGASSQVRPLGPIISPYQPYNVEVRVVYQSNGMLNYYVSGIGQIGAEVAIVLGEDILVSSTVDDWGHFGVELEVDEEDNIGDALTGYVLTMTDPNNSERSITIPLDQSYLTYTYIIDSDNGYQVSLIVSDSTIPYEFSEDGGNTWVSIDNGDPAPILTPGIYPAGLIRVRSNQVPGEDNVVLGYSYSAGSTISPYIPRDITTIESEDGLSYIIHGTAAIGDYVSVIRVNDDDTTTNITSASTLVDDYGDSPLKLARMIWLMKIISTPILSC